jgi:nicotinate-nucleotide pyrophosphorylase
VLANSTKVFKAKIENMTAEKTKVELEIEEVAFLLEQQKMNSEVLLEDRLKQRQAQELLTENQKTADFGAE